MARKPSKPKKPKYKLSLQLGTLTYTSEGDTPLEALQALKKPDKIMSRGLLTVRYDGTEKTMQLVKARVQRLFYNKIFQAVQAKYLAIALKPVKV